MRDARRRWLALVIAGILAGLALVLRDPAGIFLGRLDHCPDAACDFTRIFLPQIRALASRPGALVPGWVYPPALLVALRGLAFLPDPAALAAWFAVQAALLAGLYALTARPLAPVGRWWARVGAAALLLGSLPVWHQLKWGQVSLLVVVPVLAALAAGRGLPLAAGFGAAVKLYPLGYLLGDLARGRWRRLAAAVAWGLGLGVALPALALGPATARPFFLAPAGWTHMRTVSAALGGQGLRPTLVRLFVDGRHVTGPGAHLARLAEPGPLLFALPPGAVAAAGWLGLAALLGATALAVRRWRPSPDLGAALVLPAVTLALDPAWHHYFVFLPHAQAVLLAHGGRRAPALGAASAALGVLPLAAMALHPDGYYLCSRWGVTTASALAAWTGALLAAREAADRPGGRAQGAM